MKTNRDYVQAIMKASPTADLAKVKKYVWAKVCDDPTWLRSFVEEVVERQYPNIAADERAAARPERPASVFSHVHVAVQEARTTPPSSLARVEPSYAVLEKAVARGESRFTRNQDAIRSMRFANGRGIMEQTVADAQSYGGWFVAIIRALPKTAKPQDTLGKYLTLEQLTKLRTFDVAA